MMRQPTAEGLLFGAWLRERREALGMNGAQVAAQAGHSKQYQAALEKGLALPDHGVAVCLADVLGLSPDIVVAASGRLPADLRALLQASPDRIETIRGCLLP